MGTTQEIATYALILASTQYIEQKQALNHYILCRGSLFCSQPQCSSRLDKFFYLAGDTKDEIRQRSGYWSFSLEATQGWNSRKSLGVNHDPERVA